MHTRNYLKTKLVRRNSEQELSQTHSHTKKIFFFRIFFFKVQSSNPSVTFIPMYNKSH